jgi:hypothetical protein
MARTVLVFRDGMIENDRLQEQQQADEHKALADEKRAEEEKRVAAQKAEEKKPKPSGSPRGPAARICSISPIILKRASARSSNPSHRLQTR